MKKSAIIIFGILICTVGCISNSNNEANSENNKDSLEKGLIHLKKPSGQFGIATKAYVWTDSTRAEIATPAENDNRELYIQIWYPTSLIAKGNTASYLGTDENSVKFIELVDKEWYARFQKVRTNSILNGEISQLKEKYPVVIFSPGFGASKYYYSLFIEELTSNGIIVVAIDHPYLNPIINKFGRAVNPINNYWHNFPAAGTASSYEDGIERLQMANDYYAADHLFVFKKLKDLDSSDENFKNKIDLENVASVGHSAGTMAPMGLMARNEGPFKTYIIYDVNIHNYIAGRNIIIPNTIKTKAPIYLFILEYASIPEDEFMNQMQGDLQITRLVDASHIDLADFNFIASQENNNEHEIEKNISNLNHIFEPSVQYLKIKFK